MRTARGGPRRGELFGARRGGEAFAPPLRPVRPARPQGAHAVLFGSDRGRTADLRDRPAACAPSSPRGDPPLHHQPHRERQRPARSPRLQKEAGLLHAPCRHCRPTRPRSTSSSCIVRDDRGPARRRTDHARLLRSARDRGDGAQFERRAGHHARLLGQQQRRRLSHLELELYRSSTALVRLFESKPGLTLRRSTAAAAPSAAAADRPTRRSSPSPPAR